MFRSSLTRRPLGPPSDTHSRPPYPPASIWSSKLLATAWEESEVFPSGYINPTLCTRHAPPPLSPCILLNVTSLPKLHPLCWSVALLLCSE